MRWPVFILFAALMLTLQSAVAPRLDVLGSRPDWLLVVVVLLAMRARPFDAVLGSWIIGALADLMTIERFGLMALSYALVAMLVVSIREALFRYHGFTQFVITLITCLVVQTVWCAYRRVLYDPVIPVWADFAIAAVLGSVYTALWVPLFHKASSTLSSILGLPRPRYSYSGLRRPGGNRV